MLVDDFAALFRGRDDVWGSDHAPRHGSDEVGPGPMWSQDFWAGAGTNAVGVPFGAHLDTEGQAIGIYPVDVDGNVHWGCVDIDYGYEDSWNLAWNLVSTLDLMGMYAWVERTRSKGYHVWVFVDGVVHHNTMRAALLVASSVAGVPAKEVNPKSFDLEADKLGNYVRLPYPAGYSEAAHSQGRQVMIDRDGYTIHLHDFLNIAWDNLVMPDTLKAAAALYEPPAPKAVAATGLPTISKEVTDRLTPLAWTIYDGGPYEIGGDRSGTLWKMVATITQDETHTLEELVALALRADAKWGKFAARGDTDRVVEMCEKAWGMYAPEGS